MAQFKTNKIFSVVGIGHVLTGEILEGEIKAGNSLMLAAESYVIDAVEIVDYHNRFSEVALIFDAEIGDELSKLTGQIFTIES